MKQLLFQVAVFTCFLIMSAHAYAGNVVGCVTKYQDVNYYEIRNITRCVANIGHVGNGEYVAITAPSGRLIAYARVIKHSDSQATVVLAKANKLIKKGFVVKAQGPGFIPDDDKEISRYTQLLGIKDEWRQDF